MIKLALKHFVLESCINVIFDSIGTNFKIFKRIKLNQGDKYSILRCLRYLPNGIPMLREFHNVRIKSNENNYGIVGIESEFIYSGSNKEINIEEYEKDTQHVPISSHKELFYNGTLFHLYTYDMRLGPMHSGISVSEVIYYKL